MEGGFGARLVEAVEWGEGEFGFGGGGGRDGDGDGVVAEEMVVTGFTVDEALLGFEEMGGEEDVGAEGGEEVVEFGGGGCWEGGQWT